MAGWVPSLCPTCSKLSHQALNTDLNPTRPLAEGSHTLVPLCTPGPLGTFEALPVPSTPHRWCAWDLSVCPSTAQDVSSAVALVHTLGARVPVFLAPMSPSQDLV